MTSTHEIGDPSHAISVLHLAGDPNDTYLLAGELHDAGFANHVSHAADVAELRALVERSTFDLLIVDLPLPDQLDPRVLDELAAQRPELRVVFRWGTSGQWATESPSEQLGRSVRSALDAHPIRRQSEPQRRAVMAQLVRQQQAYLELLKHDTDDFDGALRRITSTIARALDVPRVSVWELNDEADELRCLDQFETARGEHSQGSRLRSFPRYLASLRRSLTLAADDARRDPRTSEFLEHYLEPLGITAMLDAPVRRKGRVAGVICLEHIGQGPRHWTVLEQCAATSAAGLVARALEVRDRKLAEERAARTERLNAIGQVASGVAHDLNNVLTVLLGNLDLALRPVGSAEERLQHARTARDAALGVSTLVSELLTIGREGCADLSPVDLRALAAKLEPVLRSAAGPRATFSIEEAAGELPVLADASALSRVLINLVKNAGEALAEPGRITLRLAPCQLTDALDGLPPGEYATATVDDTGAGMDATTRARLFQPFFSTKSDGRGHGLGLSTSFALIRQFGGTIRADSTPGRGSRFEVVLPLDPARRLATEA